MHFDAEVITIGCNFLGFFSLSASDFPSFAQHSCAYKYFHHLPRNISSICLKHSHYLPINVFSFLSMNISSDLQLSATPTVSSFRVSIDIFMTIRISYKMTQMKKHVFPNIWKDMHLNGSSSFQNYTAGCICENLILRHAFEMPHKVELLLYRLYLELKFSIWLIFRARYGWVGRQPPSLRLEVSNNIILKTKPTNEEGDCRIWYLFQVGSKDGEGWVPPPLPPHWGGQLFQKPHQKVFHAFEICWNFLRYLNSDVNHFRTCYVCFNCKNFEHSQAKECAEGEDFCLVRFFCNLFKFFNEYISDRDDGLSVFANIFNFDKKKLLSSWSSTQR